MGAMAKLFGEFLIEQGLASVEQILAAVITQLRTVPSTAEVIFDHALLPNMDQLRILTHQQYAGTDFRTSAAAVGLWSGTLAEKVAALARAKRRPIGEVLVELGCLSLETLAQALDSYVEAVAADGRPQGALAIPTERLTAAQRVISPQDPLPAAISPWLTREFTANYAAVINPALNAAKRQFDRSPLEPVSLASPLRSAISELVALRAASSFLYATRSEGLLSEIIATLEMVLTSTEAGHCSTVDATGLRDIFDLTIQVFDGICRRLLHDGNEEGIDADANLNDLKRRISLTRDLLSAQCLTNTQRT